MVVRSEHRENQKRESRKAAASGWIGSTLEYYDFFIYAMAASFVFPTLFFPTGNPTIGIIASLATYGVGYVARPVGAFYLGQWGDRFGRKSVLINGNIHYRRRFTTNLPAGRYSRTYFTCILETCSRFRGCR